MLRDLQENFLNSVFALEANTDAPIYNYLADDPQNRARLDVYINNTRLALMDCLLDFYPACVAMVGEDFFKTIARFYIATTPPHTGNRYDFGHRLATFLPDFLATHKLDEKLFFLPSLAQLEWQVHVLQNCTPPSDPSLRIADFETIMADLSSGQSPCLQPVEAAALLRLPYNVLDLWRQSQNAREDAINIQAETDILLVYRTETGEVFVEKVDPIIEALWHGCIRGEDLNMIFNNLIETAYTVENIQAGFAKLVQSAVLRFA